MNIPLTIESDYNVARQRCIKDLLYNYTTNDYMNEKSFKQKLIDLLYNLGYYEDNESVFLERKK